MKKSYIEKLKDPRWQKKRLEIMQRDNFTCQCCGSKVDELQIHHIRYHKGYEPWEYDNNELITYCASCHEYETTENNISYEGFEKLRNTFKDKGLSASMLNLILWYFDRLLNTPKEELENIDFDNTIIKVLEFAAEGSCNESNLKKINNISNEHD